jgi:hypothetical protein
MLIGKCSCRAMHVTILTLLGVVAASASPLSLAEQPSPETIAKLIAQLGAADVSSRQQASDKLEELGGSALPALRKAIAASTELADRRRMERVATRIENALLKTEEKHWQDFNAARRGVKDRLITILARTPDLSNQQTASAIYLLSVGRAPTADEMKQVQKQLVETNGRAASFLSVARSLVQGKEFCAAVAAVNVGVVEVTMDLAAEMELANKLHRLNSAEFQKMTTDSAAALDKAVKTDEELVDLAYLLVFSRFPKANEAETALAHLKKAGRQPATSDVFWALMNSKEFLLPR